MSRLKFLPKTPTLYLSLLFFLTLFSVCNADSVLGLNSLEKTSEAGATTAVSRGCSSKIGECFEETEMESEMSRRVLLMQKKYISYGTLKRDMVPCNTPGASYYDCGARQAHPYNRGCEVITRCARSINDINN
uniref:Protein RALF-like 24 n=1 Tax=Salix viminalis TaxID=40686 RepID=A0A6N2MXH5_SALVM